MCEIVKIITKHTLTPPEYKQDASPVQGEKDSDCLDEEKEENILYRLFD